MRDNQLDEFASQSILADVSVVNPGSASAESGSFGIQISSPQLCPEAQIPNSSTPVVVSTPVQIQISDTASSVFSDNDSLITSSDEDITDITSGNIAKKITSKCNLIENASTVKGNASESTSIMKQNTSNAKKSNVKDNASKSESDEHTNNLTNSGVNPVSPGSSLNSVSLSGGAEAPLSSTGDLNSLSADLVSSGPGLVSVLPSVSSGVAPPFFFW